MLPKLKALISSRRFWVAVAGVIGVVTDGLGIGLSADQVLAITLVAGSWIIGDTIRETK